MEENESKEGEITTITVKKKTHQNLTELKIIPREDFDGVICRLIEHYKSKTDKNVSELNSI